MRKLLTILAVLVSLVSHAQRVYKDTTLAGVTVRVNWDVSAVGAQACVWEMQGEGETGNGTLANDTPHIGTYLYGHWLKNGWNGQVTLGNGIHKPVVCTLIATSNFMRSPGMKSVFDAFIASRFHALAKDSAWGCVALSAGAWALSMFNTEQVTLGNHSFWQYFKWYVDLEGVIPNDAQDATIAYPGRFGNRVLSARLAFLGIDQDGSGSLGTSYQIQKNIIDSLSSAKAYNIFSHFGSGGHEGFNTMTDPSAANWTATNSSLDATSNGSSSHFITGGQSIIQWGLRQADTTLSGGSTPISCFAGNPDTLQLPTTTYTLHGGAFGSNGSALDTIQWTLNPDPSAGGVTITSPHSLTTGVTFPTKWGNYLFKLRVVDHNGVVDSSIVRIDLKPVVNTANPVRYDLTATSGEYFFPNARAKPWKGGDTLCLSVAGTFVNNIWGSSTDPTGGMTGDASRPIIVMGPDVGTDSIVTFRIDGHVQYVKFIQNPRNPKSLVFAQAAARLCHDITFGDSLNPKLAMHLNGASLAGQGAAGWLIKTHEDTLSDGTLMPETFMGGYLMNNIKFFYTQTENADGENYYVGHSAPRGNDFQGPVGYYPVRLDNLVMVGCVSRNSGWDGIQTSGALRMIFHDDTVINYGIKDVGSQRAGIIIGSNTRVDTAYHLYIFKGTGNGLQVFTYSRAYIQAYIDSAGTTAGGEQAIFQNNVLSIDTLAKADSIYGDRSAIRSTAPQQVIYYNLTVLHPTSSGAITSNNDAGGGLADTVKNSTFCIPGANSGTWQGLYFHLNPTPVLSNLTLTTTCGLIAPTVTPGGPYSIALPTTSQTIAVTATGNAGATITGYAWTKTSGPGATTITGNTTRTPTVSGLSVGTYVFHCIVTDSNGSTTGADVTVIVAAAPTSKGYLSFPFRVKLKTS